MSAEAAIFSTELDEAEFSSFLIEFVGPLAAHVPEAFRQMLQRLTGEQTFPNYTSHKLTVEGGPVKAFYLRLEGERGYDLALDSNYFRGHVSPDAMGLILTLYVINGMLWSDEMPERTNRYLHNAFYLLRDFAAQHPEAAEIYGAID